MTLYLQMNISSIILFWNLWYGLLTINTLLKKVTLFPEIMCLLPHAPSGNLKVTCVLLTEDLQIGSFRCIRMRHGLNHGYRARDTKTLVNCGPQSTSAPDIKIIPPTVEKKNPMSSPQNKNKGLSRGCDDSYLRQFYCDA